MNVRWEELSCTSQACVLRMIGLALKVKNEIG